MPVPVPMLMRMPMFIPTHPLPLPVYCSEERVSFCNWLETDPSQSRYPSYIAGVMTDLNPEASTVAQVWYLIDQVRAMHVRRIRCARVLCCSC